MPTHFTKDNFYDEALSCFTVFEEKITSATVEEFDRAFQSSVAKSRKNIVYLWLSDTNISRLKGESNILYIGQSKNSFSQRYANWGSNWLGTIANTLKIEHIIENYGPMKIAICDFSKFGASLLESEGQLMWWYFQNHCEYPPLNYTKTSVRRNVYPLTA